MLRGNDMKKMVVLAFCALSFAQITWAQRIVLLTPDSADIVAVLGAADKVVAVHDHNHNPLYQGKETIGFYRTLSVEPIMAQKPDVVIGSFMAMPPNIYANLRQSGIVAENVQENETIEDYQNSIIRIGELIDKKEQAAVLAHQFKTALKAQPASGKRYLLSYDGRYVAGRGTVADSLIRLAGGINAADGVEGFKPLSREAWLAAKPDIVIIAKHNEEILGGAEKLAARPELSASPAAKNGKIVFWHSDEFLRYGLHTPESIQNLHQLAR